MKNHALLRNLPNILTITRIGMAILLVAFFLHTHAMISFFHLNAVVDFTKPLEFLKFLGLSALHDFCGEFFTFDKNNVVLAYIFGFAAATDFFDGYLARKFHLTSVFGEVFDPLADKMLVLACFVGLLIAHKASPWAVFLILSREFFITGLRVVVASQKKNIKASIFGKLKTIAQIVALIFLLLDMIFANTILWIATALTLYSGADYAWTYYKNLKNCG